MKKTAVITYRVIRGLFRFGAFLILQLSPLLLLQPAFLYALSSGDQFLHTTGSQNLLDSIAPTAKAAKSKDSPVINRATFKEIGTWTTTKADAAVKLTALSNLRVWLGLIAIFK